MTKFDAEFQSSFADLGDHFGESIVYRPGGGTDRTITAIVDREGGEAFTASGDVVTYRIMVKVANDATKGISAIELNEGTDTLELARRINGPTAELIIDKLINADGGVLQLKVA